MRTLTLTALAALTATFATTLIAAPAFASSYGHGQSSGHVSHGHASHGHSSYGHGHVRSYSYHAPVYHAPVYHAPAYVAPAYHAPKPTTSYETKPAYVYQKVHGYCVEKVVTDGHGHSQRHAVECKAGEIKKAEAPIEPAPVEPPK